MAAKAFYLNYTKHIQARSGIDRFIGSHSQAIAEYNIQKLMKKMGDERNSPIRLSRSGRVCGKPESVFKVFHPRKSS